MTHVLHEALAVALIVAGRLIYVWRRPFRDDGKRRLGAGWANHLHTIVHQMIEDWRQE